MKAAVGLDDLRLYSLRHFYASRLPASGVSVKAMSVVIDHKSPEITLQIYTHLWPGDLDAIRAASAEFFLGG
ncbi:tyrosine-type recombinase/integrase [Corynebacterium sp. CCM 8835]|uniref:tyrosine-type recombinase/integrase n=1 Tax=Corynebacterium antarcticum TaxID=2800405 RepID=UPI00200EB23E|nr:tyrosine-type recombinase/integrase [Corynebacterium antarcticum]